MNQSKHDYLTIDEILNDATRMVNDERFEEASRGYYVSLVQQCLEELAFETFFDIKELDEPVPRETLRFELPAGCFNPKEIYVYTGDKCHGLGRTQRVYHKENYSTHGKGYFALNKGLNPGDPFMPDNFRNRGSGNENDTNLATVRQHGGPNNTFFYNIQDGILMLSLACRAFPMLHMKYNGTGCPIGEVPFIPSFFRQVTKDFICEHALRNRLSKDPKRWMSLWEIYDRNLNINGDHGDYKGSWYTAKKRVKRMNKADRDSFMEYMGRNQW